MDFKLLKEMVVSEIPAERYGNIIKAIKDGAKNTEREWSNAIELVDSAFTECKVTIPTPDLKKPWTQYEKAIETAVKALYKVRGIDGGWRTSYTKVGEAVIRYNVSIGEACIEIQANNKKQVVENLQKAFHDYTLSPNADMSLLSISKHGIQMKEKIKIS